MTVEAAKQPTRIESLDATIWLEAIRGLSADVMTLPDEPSTDRLMRRAYHLSLLAPDPFWRFFAAPIDEEAFEASIESGDPGESLDQLINPALLVETAKPDGKFEATVRVSELDLVGRGAGSDQTRAVLTAWCDCIVLMHSELERMLASFSDPGSRKSQSSQDRSPTRH